MIVETAAETIRVRGARTHNLQNLDVDIPAGRLVVVTGVSGSGKSSLAFDTIFAEGQRRYLESVSVHTRTLLKQLPRPEVDEVSGLPPTVSVDQRVRTAPARSTLAVTTEIYDYLRLLYARAGTAYCTECGNPVASQSVDEILNDVLQWPERSKIMVLSPMVRSRRGTHKDVFERIGRHGFVRVRLNGELLDIADVPRLSAGKTHCIDAVIDRIIVKDGVQQRLRESIELAVRESDGTCVVCRNIDGQWHDHLFSTKFSCADCNLSFATPEPRTFSFNTAWGACPDCEGFGVKGVVDDTDDIAVFRKAPCDTCGGARLQPFARGIRFRGLSIAEFTSQTVDKAMDLMNSWEAGDASLTQQASQVAARTLPDIRNRLECLQRVGVGYLNLDRSTRTLSGGEFQRARLAACLGTGLHGACFVLDEPTCGLHPRDTGKLLKTLQAIRDSGATVVVVEHDGEIMRAADHLIDIGPGAGIEGGQLVFAGSPAQAMKTSQTLTGRYLRSDRGGMDSPIDTANRTIAPRPVKSIESTSNLLIRNACRNNLQNVTVAIPLGKLVCVTGVSGSGKSSLIMETLLPVVEAHCQKDADIAIAIADAECDSIDGLQYLHRVVAVDNSPLSRNRRSCIATYSKLWGPIRKLFSQTKGARARGFQAGRFSFNSGDGRCSACKGTGLRDVRTAFLPDATVPCPECSGQRFNRATLAVRFGDRNVADVLNLRVDEAANVFSELHQVRHILETFRRVGLGYLTLGQPASTFSGGESQRVKLATELSAENSESTLFILDEPTSGLHSADVIHLVSLLRDLVDNGHSAIVIEHNTDVMTASDWLIDIGPESDTDGGRLVAEGSIGEICGTPASITGQYLDLV